MLPAPGSKGNNFREKIIQILLHSRYFGCMYWGYWGYSQCFEVKYCGYFRTHSISGFDTMNAPCKARTSRFCNAGIASAGSISPGGTVRTASSYSTKILSICTLYSEHEVCFAHLCTVYIIPSLLLCRRREPRREGWSKLLSGREFSRVLAFFREDVLRILTVFRRSVQRVRPVLPSISRFDTADTDRTRNFVFVALLIEYSEVFRPTVLIIQPVRAVFRSSVPSILLSACSNEYL